MLRNEVYRWFSLVYVRRYNRSRTAEYVLPTIDYDELVSGVDEDGVSIKTRTEEVAVPDKRSFPELGVTSRLCSVLKSLGISEPNCIQRLSLPATFKRGKPGSCVIQSETGSGKTLAYLLPALQDTRPSLTSLIITPTRELAVQVCYWARQLAGNSKNSRRISLLVSGKTENKLLHEFKEAKPHILIGTPNILKKVIKRNEEMGVSLQRLVLDEADILLEPLHPKASWRVKRNREIHPKPSRMIMEDILASIRRRRNSIQLICTSATVPSGLQEELMDIGWEGPLPAITTNQLLKQVPQSIKHTHILFTEPEEKGAELVRHFKESGHVSALVFVHRDSSVKRFTKELKEMGVAAEALYTHLDCPDKVGNILDRFCKGEIQLMVANEETVRGLDFPFLKMVYLMELPRNATEYLHSSGRVGRCGQEGRVTVFIQPQEVSRLKRMYDKLGVENYVELVGE